MEQLYCQMTNLADTYAHKMATHGLNEAESILYEKLCTVLATYFHGLNFSVTMQSRNTEMQCAEHEGKYLLWVTECEKAIVEKEREEKRLEDEANKPKDEEQES